MAKYFAAVGSDKWIWGTGKNKTSAKADGNKWIDWWYKQATEKDRPKPKIKKIFEIDSATYKKIITVGGWKIKDFRTIND